MRNATVTILILLLGSGLFCSTNTTFAQGGTSLSTQAEDLNDKQTLKMAVALILDGQLYEGDKLIDDLLIKEPENLYYNYLKGFNTLYSAKNHAKAIPYFEKIVPAVQEEHDLLSSESSVPIDVYYHLAVAYHYLEDIENAEKYYNAFRAQTVKRSIRSDEADVRLAQLEVAKNIAPNPEFPKVELIQGSINSDLAEYSSVVSANGRELYFTSRRDWDEYDLSKYRYPVDNSFLEDVYCSVLDHDNTWSEPKRLSLCAPYQNEASVSLTSGMHELYVYSDIEGNGNLFSSDYPHDNFSTIDELSFNKLNTKSWEPHYIRSEDSSLIIFSSDRKGGEGGRDLWSMHKNDDGTWTKPVNMGPSINTSEDEDAPFITLDGEHLYFASNGKHSMGGFDIFKSKISPLGVAEAPENLGTPINSTGDDLFFTITHDGLDAYFTSFRKDGVGEKDIYHIDYRNSKEAANVIALRGDIIDITEEAPPVDMLITLLNKKTNETQELLIKNDSYFHLLDECQDYTLTMTDRASGEVKMTEDLSTDCEKKPTTIQRDYLNGAYWIDGLVSDASTKQPIDVSNVEIIDNSTGEIIATLKSSDGKFESPKLVNYRPGDNLDVSLKVNSDGYESKQMDLDVLLASKGRIPVEMELNKETISVPVSIPLEDQLAEYIIYFDYDKANIRKSEIDIMNDVIKLMNENPELEIMLYSHTDSRGTNSYNKRLSDRRAKSTMNYIRKQISNPERIQAKGLGETMFAVECEDCSDEQHQLNRRTTFEIKR